VNSRVRRLLPPGKFAHLCYVAIIGPGVQNRTMPRLAFKSDSSFFRKIAVGAVGARATKHDLDSFGHSMVELENGSTDTKIWKEVKRKRVRIPDLVCTTCGLRVECRAKTSPDLAMSHSVSDAERAWDFGLVDNDIVAFPIIRPATETDWSIGALSNDNSYWHSRERVHWKSPGFVNYFRVGDFRSVAHARSSIKGVTEGSETSISWDAIFSTRQGVVERVFEDGKISVRREADSHLYTWQNPRGLPVVVEEGERIELSQVIASPVHPVDAGTRLCTGGLNPGHIANLLTSPERTQRFTGIKLARFRSEAQFCDQVKKIALHDDEDIYVRLEGATYLVRVCGESAHELLWPYLAGHDEQMQLEAVVALSEAATDEAVELLSNILDDTSSPFFLRSAVAWALGRIGTNHATTRLIETFSDVDLAVREEALTAVTSVGEAALEHLVQGLNENDSDVVAGSAEAIRRIAVIPSEVVQQIIAGIKTTPTQVWTVWLLGNLRHQRDYIAANLADLQESRPEAHYAISLLWAFLDSWIAEHWELHPEP
jgi:hypothetical protein